MKICRACGVCCNHTEMILSQKDIQRIIDNVPSEVLTIPFYVVNQGFNQLNNIDDHCVFFSPSDIRCTIYQFRPEGCKFYPMIFDSHLNKCILDSECPHHKIFYSNPSNFRKKCLDLRRWLKLHIFKEV
ncbi:MAG: YkgJ family cysteine cluster protein [Promethearchaeota archaeon]